MKPGIYADHDETAYHADPALSQSQAKVLLECPAKYRWRLDHPQAPRAVFDVGHAAHAKVLGVGAEIVVYPAEILGANGAVSTKAAKEFAAEARAAGQIPLTADVVSEVDAMAEAVLSHAGARSILESDGATEQSMWWEQDEVQCRGRVDKVATTTDGEHILIDLKTTVDANPATFGKSVASYGYHLQAGAYTGGWEAITGEAVPMVFICVEKDPPHLVSLVALDDYAMQRGREKWADAVRLWRECAAEGHWPAYPEDIATVSLPRWAS